MNDLPEPARSIATAAAGAVAAARATDPEAFATATATLAGRDAEQVGLVLGTVVRILLEDLHPDGLTAKDVRAVVARCVGEAASWYPEVDPDTVVVLLADALGLYQSTEERPPLAATAVATHGPIVIADLLGASGRPLDGYLRRAFADIAVSQAGELA